MRTAGVLRHIAADGAGALARRVRCVKIFLSLDRQSDVQVDDARLHDGALVGEIDFENPVHAGEADGDAPGARNRAPAQSRAGAAPHDGYVVLPCDFDDRDHVFGAAWKNDHLRTGLVDAAVVLIEQQVFGAVQVSARTQQGDQLFFGLGGQHQRRDSMSRITLSLIQSWLLMIFRSTFPWLSMI